MSFIVEYYSSYTANRTEIKAVSLPVPCFEHVHVTVSGTAALTILPRPSNEVAP
jgi:hypothetical protein